LHCRHDLRQRRSLGHCCEGDGMTDAPKLWRYMTDIQKGALLLAALEGSEIQTSATGSTYWHDVNPKWCRNSAYRVKPKAPKVETFVTECHVFRLRDGVFGSRIPHALNNANPSFIANITHIYTITDGVVTACDTIIHEVKT
jgi:hypothetical protein